MHAAGVSAGKFLHLDGWNGWRIASVSAEIEQSEAGLSLRRGGLPPPEPSRTRAPRPDHRGLAFDRVGQPIAVVDDGTGLCDFGSCTGLPKAWGLAESVGRIAGVAVDGRGRLFLALPELGELRVLRLLPPAELARIPLGAPSAVAVDARGQIYVLGAGSVTVLSPALRAIRTLAVPAGDAIAASPEGALIVVQGGSSVSYFAAPGASFAAVDLGRAALPAVAFDQPGEGGETMILVGDQASGRIIRYRLSPLVPLTWSNEHGAFAALAFRPRLANERASLLFALGAGCAVTPITFEEAGFRERSGVVIVGPLDAGSPGVEWHRLTAAISPEPSSSVGIRVEALAGDDCDAFDLDGRWPEARALVAPRAGRPAELALIGAKGRYAFLRLTLFGDGRRTPTLRWLRCEYPRSSYLRYLPSLYSEDTESREISARFLSIFEAENVNLGQTIAKLPRLFQPFSVDAELLPWLAERIDLLLDESWSVEKQREALAKALTLYRKRGTRAAFEVFLNDYGATGLKIVEGFRAGVTFILGYSSVAGCNAILPGGCEPPRMVLDRGLRLGHAKLDSRPYAEADPLLEHRGELLIYVPPAVAAQAGKLARIARIAGEEAPAGAEVRIIPLDPGSLLGGGARLGINASLGAARPWLLPLADGRPGVAPMLLAREPGAGADLALGQGPRLGMDSKL